MGWNGSGTFTRTNGDHTGDDTWQQDRDGAIKITAARHDTHDEDIAEAINNCLAKDGQNAMTDDLDMGGNEIINYGSSNLSILSQQTDSYTPVASSSNGDGTFTPVSAIGQYTVVGNLVVTTIDIIFDVADSPTGAIQISLPFNATGTNHGSGSIGLFQGIDTDKGLYGYIPAGATAMRLQRHDSGDNFTSTVLASDLASTVVLRATATYIKV